MHRDTHMGRGEGQSFTQSATDGPRTLLASVHTEHRHMLDTRSPQNSPDNVPPTETQSHHHRWALSPKPFTLYTPRISTPEPTDMPPWGHTQRLHRDTTPSPFINAHWTNSRRQTTSYHTIFLQVEECLPLRSPWPWRESDSRSVIGTQRKKSYNRGIAKGSGNTVERIAGFGFIVFNSFLYFDLYNKKKILTADLTTLIWHFSFFFFFFLFLF